MTDDAKLSREAIELSVAQLPDQPFAFAPSEDEEAADAAIEEAVSAPLGSLDKIEEEVDDGLDETSLAGDAPDVPTSSNVPNATTPPILKDAVATATHLVVKVAPSSRNTEEIPVLTQDASKNSAAMSGVDPAMLAEIEGFMAELQAVATVEAAAVVAPAPPAPVVTAPTPAPPPTPVIATPEPVAVAAPPPVAPKVAVEDSQHGPATEADFLPNTAAPAVESQTNADICDEHDLIEMADMEDSLIDDAVIDDQASDIAKVETIPPAAPRAPRETTHTVAFSGNESAAFSLNIPFELHAQLSRKIDQLVVEAATSITNELQTQLSERVELLLQQAVESALPALIDNMVQSLRNEVRGRIRQQLPLIVNDVLGKTRLSDGTGQGG